MRFFEAWNMNAAGSLLFVSLMVSAPFRFIQWIRAKRGANIRSTLGIETGWLIALASVMVVGWTLRIPF